MLIYFPILVKLVFGDLCKVGIIGTTDWTRLERLALFLNGRLLPNALLAPSPTLHRRRPCADGSNRLRGCCTLLTSRFKGRFMRPPPVHSRVENDILSPSLPHRRASSHTGSIRPSSPRSSFGSRSPAAANNQALYAAIPALPPSSHHRAELPLPRSPLDPSTPRVGSRVKVSHKQKTLFGRVLYVGQTHFSTRPETMWAGIRLDEPSGNHDGEFKGERYFTCEPKHGLFQHLGNIKVIDNFEAPLAYSPKLHSTPLASASTASSVLGALAQSPNTRRADNLSSPRGAATVPQMLCPSTHSMSRRTITSPVDNTYTYTSTRRNSGSINSTNINDECIQSITLPDTARKPPAAETASIIATNRDELLDATILEVGLCAGHGGTYTWAGRSRGREQRDVIDKTHIRTPSLSPLFFYSTQQILYSSAVHEKLAGMISEEVEKKVQERLQQVREDTTAQLTRETSFMSTFVNGAIVRIEDKVRQDYSLSSSYLLDGLCLHSGGDRRSKGVICCDCQPSERRHIHPQLTHRFSPSKPTYLQITELKDSIIINAVAATGSREDQEQMERNKQALAAIMEIASATKQQLQEEVKQRAEAIQQLCIMSEEETEGP